MLLGRPRAWSQGWRSRRDDPFPLLLAGSIALFLVVFSTRVPVYDGERLFLLVFPLWAILIGRGSRAALGTLGAPALDPARCWSRSCWPRGTAWSRSTRSG